jgi:protein-tyrosine phosphatase
MKRILFVCTGNYYRSRIAEIIFNHMADQQKLPVNAFSRGLRLNPLKNIGTISPHALPFLTFHRIPADKIGEATLLDAADLRHANHIIVMDEKEHRPMIRTLFPEWEHKVEYWQLEDDYVVSPDTMLPALKGKVEQLVVTLRSA